MNKRPRGRPKKAEDSMKASQFGRAAVVICAYDEFRKKPEKYKEAIKETVASLKRSNPKMPISNSEVNRILARFRPKGSKIVLLFERSRLSEEDIKKYRAVFEQAAAWHEEIGTTLPQLPALNEKHGREKFLIRFSERPDYPRHNRKSPKE
jgi:hypothetical protein